MKHLLKAVFAIFALVFSFVAGAADRGTPAEAEAMVKKAITFLKANGKEKAIAEFNNPKGQFREKDLYIVAFDMNGMGLAHPNPKLVGKATPDIKDADGKPIFRSYVETVNSKGKGWVDYKWPNPVSGVIDQKSTYVEKTDDLIIGCGVYK